MATAREKVDWQSHSSYRLITAVKFYEHWWITVWNSDDEKTRGKWLRCSTRTIWSPCYLQSPIPLPMGGSHKPEVHSYHIPGQLSVTTTVDRRQDGDLQIITQPCRLVPAAIYRNLQRLWSMANPGAKLISASWLWLLKAPHSPHVSL